MKRSWLIVPDFKRLDESVALAEEFGAAFEYDDFFKAEVYNDAAEVERLIEAYLALGRDTSADTLHGVFFDIKPNSMDPIIREQSRKLMRQSLEIGARMGVRGVVFHSDVFGGMRVAVPAEVWLKNAEALYRQLCGEFPQLCIYLENTVEQEPDQLVELARRMSDVPNFKLCLDYAHAMLTATDGQVWMRQMGPFVGHMHLNDHDGRTDLHAAVGEGTIDYARFAALADNYIPGVPALLEMSSLEAARQSMERLNAIQPQLDEDVPAKLGELSAQDLYGVLETSLALSREKDKVALLDTILTRSMEIANCDGGTLYMLKDNELQFKIMKTISMGVDRGGDGQEIPFPPVKMVESNVSAWSAIHAKAVSIDDVYEPNDIFDFSGPIKFDASAGYKTKSMMAVPLMDDDRRVLGVMQLINAQDAQGNLCSFSAQQQRLIGVLAAQAAITMKHMAYIEEIRTLMWDFTSAMATAIDQRTPYNGSHTRKVAEYSRLIAERINQLNAEGQCEDSFDEARTDQLVMAALMHDIGKMIIPTKIMDKPTRLGDALQAVEWRIGMLKDKKRIEFLEGQLEEAAYNAVVAELDEAWQLVCDVNSAGFVPKETQERIAAAAARTYEVGGQEVRTFTEDEETRLMVMKGTLTDEERSIMQSHVVMTDRILKEVHFTKEFKDAPKFAAQHHEFLNGKGYPNGLTADELPLESRILTVADIDDALMADDRPYKKAMPKERAFSILYSMADDGQVERRLVEYLEYALENLQ